MKKLLLSLFALATICINSPQANAISFDEALKQTKPFVMLIYANWADDVNTAKQNFDSLSSKYGAKYNFVSLDIASPETKSYNKRFQINPNLPYIMLYRENGKISRYLPKECTLNQSCIKQKMDLFAN